MRTEFPTHRRRHAGVAVVRCGLIAWLFLAAACSTKPPRVRAPLWPSWATNVEWTIGNYLASAAGAWDVLQAAPPGSSEYQRAEATYEFAVAEVLSNCSRRQLPKNWQDGGVFRGRAGAYALGFPENPHNPVEISATKLDRLRLAETVKLGRSRPTTEEGIGVPVVGQIMRTKENGVRDPMLPLNGAQLTLTAIIEFGEVPDSPDKPRAATLRLINPLHEPRPNIGSGNLPLAANYTAAKKLALRDGFLQRFRFVGLMMPDKVVDDCRLYMLAPYDPKRIPVVFVHGLLATPHNWYPTVNAIDADPELRARYQPWYFLYPTGLDVPYTANRLRESLIEARNRLDPDHNDPGMNQMVLVGHSMGGLLCRMQTSDSKDLFWQACFNCEIDKLKLSPENRKRLVSSLQFERQPYVKRLILLAVPHRGSRMADISLFYRLRSLIKLPSESVLLTKEVLTGNADALAPQIRKWGSYAFLSLGTLSPKHPYLEALNAQPIPIPHHSIIGRIGNKPLEESSDGVVPYRSSHLDTGTEVVLNHWHALTDEKETVAEVVRRLKQHLREIP
ncbi:MAG TPA: hypothetical protein VD994_12540 [Prosthecobacter sp.]|nr:hypothetical protein [Prosthecobacter sp.]